MVFRHRKSCHDIPRSIKVLIFISCVKKKKVWYELLKRRRIELVCFVFACGVYKVCCCGERFDREISKFTVCLADTKCK